MTWDTSPAWMRPFTRITSRGDFIPEIDGLRFFALLGVFLLHLNHIVVGHEETAPSVMTLLLEGGNLGVQLFFVISGFILSLPFARAYLAEGKPISLKAYFLRRLTRLEPPLIINVTLILLLMVLVLKKPLGELLPHYFATCTYSHWAIFGTESTVNGVTWSLEVEARFYLAMPLLAVVFKIRSMTLRRGVMLAAMIASGLVARDFSRVALTSQIGYFLAGFLLADLWLHEWKNGRSVSAWFDLGALLAGVGLIASYYFNRQLPLPGVAFRLLMLAFCFCALKGKAMLKLLRFWVTAAIGGMCYTFYLYHVVLLAIVGRVAGKWVTTSDQLTSYALHFVIAAPVLLVTSFILFALTERPFMKWRPAWARS